LSFILNIWKILVLVYETTDFSFIDYTGTQHHFVANISETEKQKISYAVNLFVKQDIPILNSGYMKPTITIRYPNHELSELSFMGGSEFAPGPDNVAADRDPEYDSVITIWDGSGIDQLAGEPMSIQGCGWAWNMGIGQTYDVISLDCVHYNERNVFKHEWGHSILFYYEAAGTAPKPAVDNHINDTTNRYVNCISGESYILQDETDENPIPNSIYNNNSGFTHDYYSGKTATADKPNRCLGIPSSAWASGGPVTVGPMSMINEENHWHNPSDDEIINAVPYHCEEIN